MNEMNPLEKQLQSWTPRRPSAEIASRLFPQPEKPRPVSRWAASSWHWLTPAAACVLAVMVVVGGNNRHTQFEHKDRVSLFATMMLNASSNFDHSISDQNFALNQEHNVWPHASLRTTNFSSEFATLGALLSASTNR